MDKKTAWQLVFFCGIMFIAGINIAADDENTGLGRDPFKRGANLDFSNASMLKDGVSNVQLSGIVYDKQSPVNNYCIINNQLLRLGDDIEGYVVTGIQDNFIIITSENDNKDYKIKLWDMAKDSS